MTNEQIILNVRLQLMEEGKIGSTGRFFEMQGQDGTLKKVPEPEEIHSFSRWKECGYGVKKGEKAIAKVEIWKYAESKKTVDGKLESDEEETKERIFKKSAFFFSASQVEPLREGRR